MIKERVADLLSIKYEKRLLIQDTDVFSGVFDYLDLLESEGFNIVLYENIEAFRLRYEIEIKNSPEKWAVIVADDFYVPYDIRSSFFEATLRPGTILPKLDETVITRHSRDLDIISFTYDKVHSDKLTAPQTKRFIEEQVFAKSNVQKYCALVSASMLPANRDKDIGPEQWCAIARVKAMLEVYAAQVGLILDMSFVEEAFAQFVFNDYQKLAGQVSSAVPIFLPKVLDYIAHDKAALIVIDGMSLFDFDILSRYFYGIEYKLNCSFALIPTTTAISRQSLLTGKYPRQLENPFSLSDEEKGFYDAATERRYTKQQTAFMRGFDVVPSPFVKLLAVIINDVDEIVHGQRQGRFGMYSDMTLLAKSGKIQGMIRSLHKMGFTIYLTSDHGNTFCKGIGNLRNAGVEVESKAKRMVILKGFTEVSQAVADHTLAYPGYYMDQDYQYRVCESGVAFDNKNSEIMTHGGITIDEVIVPFVKIKAVE